MSEQFADVLTAFEPITLKELDTVRLLNRVDTKFLMSQRQLLRVLPHIAHEYQALEVNGTLLNRYRTLYFDTPDFFMYTRHHNGAGNRYKVRSREYVETGVSFLEVKHKNNKARTIKKRLQTAEMVTALDDDSYLFLAQHCPIDGHKLEPKLWNRFIRITLASQANTERLTLDLGLTFEVDQVQISFPDVVVAEVKQERFSVHSHFFKQMRQQRIRPMGFSKYCVGIARMYPTLKQNRFKERLMIINRLSRLSV
ncbi:MAG: polyphosphate polymerase domain-containing protein [Chloroflexota bacterium]